MQKIESFLPKQRFSNRVADYVKYRPSYPDILLDTLVDHLQISSEATVADIGSGTGIFSRLLLDRGLNVIGVEPNDAMREYAEESLGQFCNFTSVNGSAERTTLEPGSADVVTVAQAFHWFRIDDSVQEFDRILKKDGAIILLWNVRKPSGSSFQREYDALITAHCPEYKQVDHKKRTLNRIHDFFRNRLIDEFHFDNRQVFDLESLAGRLRSSSYSPEKTDAKYRKLYSDLKLLFDRHQKSSRVAVVYDTVMYCIR